MTRFPLPSPTVAPPGDDPPPIGAGGGGPPEARAAHLQGSSSISSSAILCDAAPSTPSDPLAGETFPGSAETAPRPNERAADTRYEDLGLLGLGGMGEVRRVRDRVLNRVVALKRLRPELAGSEPLVARFLEEAQCTAQLQHPAVPPIHDLGWLPDGRAWFTMPEVRGRTLGEVIREVHQGAGTWTFRRLIEAFRTVCEGVAAAHERGVTHRDLKPANIMLGAHGEVLVMDWGLAKVGVSAAPGPGDPEPVRTTRRARSTQVGQVTGTPVYMAPEQAEGRPDAVGPLSDVYALGAILYEILCGRPPFTGKTAWAVVEKVRAGPPRRVVEAARRGTVLPEELVAVCEQAMAREQAARLPSATAVAEAVTRWLDGARRREQALALVADAEGRQAEISALREEARALRAKASALLAPIPRWAPEETKAPGWAMEAAAVERERAAERAEVRQELLWRGALAHVADLPEAHAALAGRFLEQHREAEAARDPAGAVRAEAQLREHLGALPERHPVRVRGHAWLSGEARLSLLTDPPGAEVWLEQVERHHRRLVATPVGPLGTTPLVDTVLPFGSYRLRISAPGREEVLYPVALGRGGRWDCTPPGARRAAPVWLPPAGSVGPEERYVPGGWCDVGGDPEAQRSLSPRRVWVDSFVAQRFMVTVEAYFGFLNSLSAQGRLEEALRYAPRERSGTQGNAGAALFGLEDGRFFTVPDADGDQWAPQWPMIMIDAYGADAYAAWERARTGLPWRLPEELEWEKMARGVDRRWFPWGDQFDPSYANTLDSQPGRAILSVVDQFPVDESPYGVRGLAGNARQWTATPYSPDGTTPNDARVPISPVGAETRLSRGGGYSFDARFARSASRPRNEAFHRYYYLGFRLVRSIG